jgi:hypothetical protein
MAPAAPALLLDALAAELMRSADDQFSSEAPMDWSDQQRAQLAQEYTRIGYAAGDRWPAPSAELTPDQLLALFGRIPDGSGRPGYIAELAKLAQKWIYRARRLT